MKNCLLVVDMQVGLFGMETPRFDSENVIKRINQLSVSIRENNGKIIFIQHNDAKGECLEPGTPQWEILPELIRQKSDLLINKTANSAFYKTNLEQVLAGLKPDQLIITGCATDFCVDSTIKSAVNRDFAVTVVTDTHTTADRPHLDAETIIKHYNFVWEHLLIPDQKVKMKETETLLKEIKSN